MSVSPHIAQRALPKARSRQQVMNSAGFTDDIIKAVISVARESASQCREFAPSFERVTVAETTAAIHAFIRRNIKYIEDRPGVQYIKTPARTWSDRFADCKGYSILTSSILSCLGIPHAFRFVTFQKGSKTPKHVYVVAFGEGETIPIDACIAAPNEELPFQYKKDIAMTKIVKLSSAAIPVSPVRITDKTTEAELELMLRKQRLQLEANIASQISGIGTIAVPVRLAEIEALDDALENVRNPRELMLIGEGVDEGDYNDVLHGIGSPSQRKARKARRKQKRQARRAGRQQKRKSRGGKTRVGQFIKKVAKVAAKGAKVVAKVATTPQRLFLKGLLEVGLPKASPFFLYLFIKDPATVRSLPASVANKRKGAQKLANFIVKAVGMKENHFMGVVRNGIMKRYGKTPEQVVYAYMKGNAAVSGASIGFVNDLIVIVMKVVKLFKKKAPADVAVSAGSSPTPNDWQGASTKTPDIYAQNQNQQSPGQVPGEVIPVQTGGRVYDTGEDQLPESGGSEDSGESKKNSMLLPLLVGGAALLMFNK